MKINLKLGDIYQLENELSGNQNLGQKGVLNQNISVLTKFRLSETLKVLQEYKTNVDETRNTLIKKYGKEDEESKQIKIEPFKSEGVLSDEFVSFNQELDLILKEERDVDFFKFDIQDFDFKSEETYPILFKVLSEIEKV